MAKKKHFKDPEHWKIKRGPNSEYLRNCNSGYYRDTGDVKQIHHIVCMSSMRDPYIERSLGGNIGDMMVIRFCLAETDWNINAAHNLIGLPLKRALVSRPPRKWGGLPIHMVDHDHMYEEMHNNLKENVWDPALSEAEECEFDSKSLEAELKDLSDTWREWIIARGMSHGGTKYCWRNRESIPDTWYLPFSMSPRTPRKRKAPPELSDFTDDFKAALKKLFSAIR